jgi:hypothetical protein
MSKAEATTGLAPKKASAPNPLMAATKSPSEGFVFELLLSLVEFRGLGKKTRAGLLWSGGLALV